MEARLGKRDDCHCESRKLEVVAGQFRARGRLETRGLIHVINLAPARACY